MAAFWAKIKEVEREWGWGWGGWRLCRSGRNRDAVFKPLRPPRRSRGDLWVGT